MHGYFSNRLLALLAGTFSVFGMLAIAGIEPGWAITFKQSSIGYHTLGPKIAILEDVPDVQKVEVSLYDPTRRNPKFPVLLGATVYKIESMQVFQDPSQQGPANKTILLDFSDFKTPGTYELHLEGSDLKSAPIKINEFLYWDALKPVVRTFYFQRCGNDIEDKAFKLFHAACHVNDAQLLNNAAASLTLESEIDVVGGWHNGSDYAKYVTSTALSSAQLMAMHEWDPRPFKYFRLDYPLFEPGYGTTDDLHHEIKAGLDWLLTMQRKDGALYRKVAGLQWPGNISPENDEQDRNIYGISTQDTAAGAAALAMATRDFKKADLGYSVKSLRQAEKAWEFLEAHPQPIYQRSAKDFAGSGEFLTDTKGDLTYRLWAAAELYTTTGKEKYHQYFLTHLQQVPIQPVSWMNPVLQGISDYLFLAKNQNAAAVSYIKQRVIALADNLKQSILNDVNLTGLPTYGFSSNADVAERAGVLLTAYRLSGDTSYRDAASRSIAYLFGLNPLGQIYLTGLEEHSVKHPAHRWMLASQIVIPGYLVDGPNDGPQDAKTPKGQGVRSYTDEADATSSNEVRILNNSALAYALAVLNDAYNATPNAEDSPASQSPLDFQLAPERPLTRTKRTP